MLIAEQGARPGHGEVENSVHRGGGTKAGEAGGIAGPLDNQGVVARVLNDVGALEALVDLAEDCPGKPRGQVNLEPRD